MYFSKSVSFLFAILVLSKCASSSPSSLISAACSNTGIDNFDVESCIDILESDNKTSPAKNFRDLSVGIMEAGIANATLTRAYLVKKSSEGGSNNSTGVFRQCKLAYDNVIVNVEIALSDLKVDPPTATYDLGLAANDSMQPCIAAVRRGNVTDGIVLTGNKSVLIYLNSAVAAVDRIK
ncbi:hypothetical protein ABFS82_03G083000 [Erythranthe guttata]|uniref:Uncharacterized protein n=1 Tax=Erythranthe guttata TaxID=4155 RepID=A0A022PRQ6_ERYGU|nr:hypothetical protein MIMGU_mgv1a014776mg [Erythranthe guttata]